MLFTWCRIFFLTLWLLLSRSQAFPHASNTPAHQSTPRSHNQTSLTPYIITEFPRGTWLENLVIRQSDGNALVTVITAPELYLMSTDDSFNPVLVASFSGYASCLGIVELGHNVFYVIAGNWNPYTLRSTPGTYALWRVDMRGVKPERAKISKIADFPQAGFLNGLTVLNPVRGILLLADSLYSAVWSVDINTGNTQVVINDTTMAPVPGSPAPLGINSLHVLGNYLYFDNTDRTSFHRIPIDLGSGRATGPVTTLLRSDSSTVTPDDFVIDFRNNVWLTADLLGELDFLPGAATPGATSTQAELVAGSKYDQKVAGWTAAQFGTKVEDVAKGSLYVTTNGGPLNYATRNWTSGGQLIRLDTADFGVY